MNPSPLHHSTTHHSPIHHSLTVLKKGRYPIFLNGMQIALKKIGTMVSCSSEAR
jgi:hypothetical protein